MGYHICDTPGPRWFAARAYLVDSFKSIKALPPVGAAKSIKDLCYLYQIRLGFARGILLIAGHRADSGNIYINLQRAAAALLTSDADLAGKVQALSVPQFSVSYDGSGQYGVPNYVLQRGAESESATQKLGPLFQSAYAERLAHAGQLRQISREMLFTLYWRESSYNLTYYSHWESLDAEAILETAIRHGVFTDRVDALISCEGALDQLEYLDVIIQLGKKLQKEGWRDYHDSQLAEFDELDAIWHGHSD